MYDVNKKGVSAPKVIAKEHTGLLKFCSGFGLSSVAKFCFMDHVNVYQEKTSILHDEN